MKLLYLSCLTLLSFNAFLTDPIDKFAQIIGTGNMHELDSILAPVVELTIMDITNTYSRAQAEIILTNFFNQNKPINSKILRKTDSGTPFREAVVMINTGKGSFRAAFTLKNDDGNLQLIELRLESGNSK
jgi:hypothetical protein